jgi:hypothetical protein
MKQVKLAPEGRYALLLTCLINYAGCSVDHRHLQVNGQAGFWVISGTPSGGEVFGGNASEAGESATPIGGAANAAGGTAAGSNDSPSASMLIDGCADLDQDESGDCQETQARNATFDRDVNDWTAEAEASIEWSTRNRYAEQGSGSALVTLQGLIDADGQSLRAATQCVVIDGGTRVAAYANVLAESGQGQGSASLGGFFFETRDCSGPMLGPPLEAFATALDLWQVVAAEQSVPNGAHSLLVRLGVTKPYRSASFGAYFDDVLVTTTPKR